LLLAVLERRAGLELGDYDAYVKVTGGLRLDEPAVDLAAAVALYSSFVDRPVRKGLVVVGELGLGGEVRGVHRAAQRLLEAEKLGFGSAVVPRGSAREIKEKLRGKLKLTPASSIAEALEFACTPG
jgi:DNA repair protein RadA/Sms